MDLFLEEIANFVLVTALSTLRTIRYGYQLNLIFILFHIKSFQQEMFGVLLACVRHLKTAGLNKFEAITAGVCNDLDCPLLLLTSVLYFTITNFTFCFYHA